MSTCISALYVSTNYSSSYTIYVRHVDCGYGLVDINTTTFSATITPVSAWHAEVTVNIHILEWLNLLIVHTMAHSGILVGLGPGLIGDSGM
jgi:hypothetical protein